MPDPYNLLRSSPASWFHTINHPIDILFNIALMIAKQVPINIMHNLLILQNSSTAQTHLIFKFGILCISFIIFLFFQIFLFLKQGESFQIAIDLENSAFKEDHSLPEMAIKV